MTLILTQKLGINDQALNMEDHPFNVVLNDDNIPVDVRQLFGVSVFVYQFVIGEATGFHTHTFL